MRTEPCAIVGIGMTEFSKDSGRSELRLAVEAVAAALEDAGLPSSAVDGLTTYALDNNNEEAVARNLGLQSLTFFARTPFGGGGACGCVMLAALAIEGRKADTVVCYRAMNERSQQRFGLPRGQTGVAPTIANSLTYDRAFTSPFGMVTPAASVAHTARRYMHQFGATSEDFGRVAVTQRVYANRNPHAYFRDQPMTLDDHQASRMICDPLRLFDCCQESDGAVAIVVTSLARARHLRQRPVAILATAEGNGPQQHGFGSPYTEDLTFLSEIAIVARQLWEESGLTPDDIDVASIYDHFSPAVLMQLEALGFCGRGEAAALVEGGGIALGGLIPTNTNGGHLSEGYVHGFNGIAEIVRQLRGTASNQVSGARYGLATSASHGPTSGAILGAVDL